jgi:hypothetical protein
MRLLLYQRFGAAPASDTLPFASVGSRDGRMRPSQRKTNLVRLCNLCLHDSPISLKIKETSLDP